MPKIRTQNSKDFNSFVSEAGNGTAVPQFELNEKTMLLQEKKTKDGKRVVHNLYDDIQKFRDVNSLERILKLAQDGDLEKLDFRCKTEEEAKAKSADYSDVKSMAEMKDLQNRLARQGKTLDDLQNSIMAFIQSQRDAAAPKAEKKTEKVLSDADKAKLYDEIMKKNSEVKQDENKK